MPDFYEILNLILKYFLLPIISSIFFYYFGIYRERRSKKYIHDKKIFDKIYNIINSEEMAIVIDNAKDGYLPFFACSKSECLNLFIKNTANKFIDVMIQNKFLEFDKSLYNLASLYASSSFGNFIDTNSNFKVIKLVYHKYGDINNSETKLIKENVVLVKILENKYSEFRLSVKKKFLV